MRPPSVQVSGSGLAARRRWRFGDRGFYRRELSLFAGAYVVYNAARWLFTGDLSQAHWHAESIMRLERELGLAVEASVQHRLDTGLWCDPIGSHGPPPTRASCHDPTTGWLLIGDRPHIAYGYHGQRWEMVMARWSDLRYASARSRSSSAQHGTTRIGAPRAPIRAAPLACVRHSRLADTREGRRARAQGEAPASQQRSCLGALVRASARCWVGRIGAVGRREAREQAGCSFPTDSGVYAGTQLTPASDERRSSALTPSSRPLSMEAGVSDGLVRRVAR